MRCLLLITTPILLLHITKDAHAAGAAIQLSVVRLNVEPHQRTASLTVSNQTAKEQHYRISIIDMVMDTDGRLVEIDPEAPPNPGSASQWLLATPRIFNLAPRQSQKIRILIRRPPGLVDGEYRAHLRVAQQPPRDTSSGLPDEVSEESGLQMRIAMVHAVTVPVFVGQGSTYSAASIVDVGLTSGGKRVTLDLKREGNRSFRGFVEASVGTTTQIYLPCVIYAERDRVNLAYDMGALVDSTDPIHLSLYDGDIPGKGETPTGEVLSSFVFQR